MQIAKATLDTAATTKNINIAFANATAAALSDRYAEYTKILKPLAAAAGEGGTLTSEGILAYLQNLVIQANGGVGQLMGMKAPVKYNYADEIAGK